MRERADYEHFYIFPWHILWQSFNLTLNVFQMIKNMNAGRVAFLANFQVWFIFHSNQIVLSWCCCFSLFILFSTLTPLCGSYFLHKNQNVIKNLSGILIFGFSTIDNFFSRVNKLPSPSHIKTAEFIDCLKWKMWASTGHT